MADLSKPRVVAVGGPTASGKTTLSVALAKAFDGEIINADSMQIYKNLDVGTAKPSTEERQGIPHYLLDFLEPEMPYSVADFTAAADPLIRKLTARGKLPVVVGGTGLYITSLLNGMNFAPEKIDPAIRARLQARADAEGGATLYAQLQSIDPDYAAQVHPNNLPRVIRALELYEATGRKMSAERISARAAEPPYRSLCLCLTCRDRAALYDRIGRRVDLMVKNGVLDEAKQVYDHRESYRTALQVVAKDRLSLIMDVSTALAAIKTRVSSLNARSTPDGFTLITMDVDVSDREQLRGVIRRLEQISGVMRVTRPAG